jgi:hypothetical protein
MKRYRWTWAIVLAVAIGLACSGPANASDPGSQQDKMFRASIGLFMASDIPEGVSADTGFTISLERSLSRTQSGEVLVGVRYSRYGVSDEWDAADVSLFHPTVEYHWLLGSEKQTYIGLGIGMVFASMTGDNGKSNDIAGSFVVGKDFGPAFAELRTVGGGKRAEQGVILAVGSRF